VAIIWAISIIQVITIKVSVTAVSVTDRTVIVIAKTATVT